MNLWSHSEDTDIQEELPVVLEKLPVVPELPIRGTFVPEDLSVVPKELAVVLQVSRRSVPRYPWLLLFNSEDTVIPEELPVVPRSYPSCWKSYST